MKRRDLLDHLAREGCVMHREGSDHSVYFNPENGHLSTVPRHREIDIFSGQEDMPSVGDSLAKRRGLKR